MDIEHVKRHMEDADETEAARLRKLRVALSDELAVCYEAIEKLEI